MAQIPTIPTIVPWCPAGFSSIATASSIARSFAMACRIRRGNVDRSRDPARRARGDGPAGRRGLPLIVVTNQPDVARGTQTRRRSRRSTATWPRTCRYPRFTSVITTTPTTATAASPSPACSSSRGGARDRPGTQLHGRRPLERHRRRPGGGMPDDFDRMPYSQTIVASRRRG